MTSLIEKKAKPQRSANSMDLPPSPKSVLKFIDLFCGIGGFRIAAEEVCQQAGIIPSCVFSSDIDPHAQQAYKANFDDLPKGDITEILESSIPDHDVLFAGFPCQAFSICGDMRGFEDARGTMFFHVARILKEKKPQAFILENVKMLKNHNKGETLKIIIGILENLGYVVKYDILNALNYGLPQKRERIFIVGTKEPTNFSFPTGGVTMRPLSEILEHKVDKSYFASQAIRTKRLVAYQGSIHNSPMIWHENISGSVNAYPYSCALRSGASYNYLLVNGERRLTEREMLRLQGFPDRFKIVGNYSTMKKLAGNSLPIPCARAVFQNLLVSLVKQLK